MTDTQFKGVGCTASSIVCWFTGLSGAGKTTIAGGVEGRLRSAGLSVKILDGDAVRGARHRHLGFSEADIKENNRLIAELCVDIRDQQNVILVPIISPYAVSRSTAREKIGDGFCLVYCRASLAEVSHRDVKGLYARAAAGEISNLIGYSPGATYEQPTDADIILDTDRETVSTSVDRLFGLVIACLETNIGRSLRAASDG